MIRVRRSVLRSGLAGLAAALLAGCASFGSAPGGSGESVGLEVRNGLQITLAIWLDGRILDFVPPFRTVCIRIPIPFQTGIIQVTDNELPVRNSITRSALTRFETRSGWSIEVTEPIRVPAPTMPSSACA